MNTLIDAGAASFWIDIDADAASFCAAPADDGTTVLYWYQQTVAATGIDPQVELDALADLERQLVLDWPPLYRPDMGQLVLDLAMSVAEHEGHSDTPRALAQARETADAVLDTMRRINAQYVPSIVGQRGGGGGKGAGRSGRRGKRADK